MTIDAARDAWRGMADASDAWRGMADASDAWRGMADASDAWRGMADASDAWRGMTDASDAGRGMTDASDAGRDARHTTADASDAGHRAPDATGDSRDAARDGVTAADAGDARTVGDGGDGASDAPADATVNPVLTSLAVTPLTLQPAFSPDVHDYYLRCDAGENAVAVSAIASTGAMVSILQPVASGPAAEQSVMLTLVEDDAVVVQVSQGETSESYWVRCLPADFPTLSMVQHPEAGTPSPGYYLVGSTDYPSTEAGYGIVLDSRGTPVWYGRTANAAGAKDTERIDSNTISFIHIQSGQGAAAEIHTLDPVGVSYLTAVGLPLDTHEFRRLPNGDYVLFATPVVESFDLTGLDGFGDSENIVDCVLQQIHPDGELAWQWDATSHFSPTMESTYPLVIDATNDSGQSVTAVDVFHCNSIDWDADGNFLVSMKSLDAVSLISHDTQEVLWKMGGTPYNKDGAPHITVTGDPLGGFFRQHDARFLPDGTLSMFDDQTGKPGPARGLVLSYDVDAGTAAIAWQYLGTGSVNGEGSLTILGDGSHVIGWGSGTPSFTELSADGTDLLDFTFPDRDQSYRAIKVPLSDLSIDVMRAAVGPWSSSTGVPDAGGDARPD